MDYEKSYKEALQRAKELHESGNALTKVQMEIVFQELKENKDEKIREELIGALMWQRDFLDAKGPHDNNLILPGFTMKVGDILAYLERQKDLAAIPNELIKNYKLFCEQGGQELALLINAINGFNKLKEQQPMECNEHDERIRKWLIEMVEEIRKANPTNEEHNGNCSEAIAYLERKKEKKMPDPEYCGENKRYPTEYCIYQDIRKRLIALVEKFGQEEDKDEMLDYLEKYQPVQSAREVKEYNFQPGDPDEKAIKRLKAMIYYACDESSCVPPDEACALDDWLDDKCKSTEWSEEDENKLYQVMETLLADKTVALRDNPHCTALHEAYDEMLAWLNSLNPQSHWKPSKDEITAIEVAMQFLLAHTSDEQLRKNVISVIEHLKQL